MRCEHLRTPGVYVLGALSPPEREAYERHLADCAECRAEVADLAELPALLGRLDPEIAAQIALASDDSDPPDDLSFLDGAPLGRPAARSAARSGRGSLGRALGRSYRHPR